MIAIFQMIHRLLEYSGPYAKKIRWAYPVVFLRSLCTNAPIILGIYTIMQAINQSLSIHSGIVICAVLLVCACLQSVLQSISDRLQAGTGYQIFADKRIEFGAHLRTLPMGYFTAGNLGKISTILSQDMVYIEEQAMNAIANVVGDCFSQILLTLFLFWIHPMMGAIALVSEGIALLIGHFMVNVSRRNAKKRQQVIEELGTAVLEYTEGLPVAKSYHQTGKSARKLRSSFADMSTSNIAFEAEYSPYHAAMLIVFGIGITLHILCAIYLVGSSQMEPAVFAGLLLFVFQIYAPLRHLFTTTSVFSIMENSLNRVEEVMQQAPLQDDGTQTVPEQAEQEIAFDHVSFSYGSEQVLHNLSFHAKRQQMIALVGESGSGKTTIANLLARFWDIDEGEIRFRGINIQEIPLSGLMEQISMVFQNVYLFEDTVFNNIHMGRTSATKEQVIEAAKKARCYDFIMDMPYGFDTRIGEGGSTLSGGQAQRISIARCILKDAPVIILDEATASMDADNEAMIQQALSELCKDKTTIVIAHRLHTVRHADKLLVIKEGNIIEQGNHDELLAKKGVYYQMLEAENKPLGW
ncbi:MAG: ABC transporter ATP-binding protein [Erysipelotrichaceae bacterium]|nr:ABC transporter ATP-binding protein [Erysipelotrichaceae bacterium]